jgi:MoaA/NifB/PqqE/SkfB family radical SAM enzyme
MNSLSIAKQYKKERKYRLAIEELQKALKLGYGTSDIYLELAWLYHDIQDNDSAIESLKKALKLGRNDNEVRLGLAKLYCEKGEYDKALKELNTALDYELYDGCIYYNLGWIHREKGEYSLSVSDFERAGNMEPYNKHGFSKNMILNEIEISQRSTFLKSKPMVLGVTLTHRCNIGCTMCEVRKRPWDIPERIVKEIIEILPYLKYIYWQGGEPFLSDYFEELFEKASMHPALSQTIVTNGLLINEDWAEKLARSNVDIIYSIDGTNKKTYEKIRNGAKFEDLIMSINLINKYRTKYRNSDMPTHSTITIQAVMMKSNYIELEEFVKFSEKYNFDCLNIIPIRYTDTQENIFLNNDPQALSYIKNVMPKLVKKSEEIGLKLFNQLPEIDSSDISNSTPNAKTGRKDMLCYWPWKSLYILRDGNVKPYGFCEEHIGNVNKDSLQDIWNSDIMQKYRQRLINCGSLNWCSLRCTSGVMPKHSLMLNEQEVYGR